jgi:hypothetical protein
MPDPLPLCLNDTLYPCVWPLELLASLDGLDLPLLVLGAVDLRVPLTSQVDGKAKSWARLLSPGEAGDEHENCCSLEGVARWFLGRLIRIPIAAQLVGHSMRVLPIEKPMEIGPFLTLDLKHESA